MFLQVIDLWSAVSVCFLICLFVLLPLHIFKMVKNLRGNWKQRLYQTSLLWQRVETLVVSGFWGPFRVDIFRKTNIEALIYLPSLSINMGFVCRSG
jgi:hypothetical protein